jgi:hypothetical protein
MPLDNSEKALNTALIIEKNESLYKKILVTIGLIENIKKLKKSNELVQHDTNVYAPTEMLPPTKTYKEIIENKYHIKK